MDTTTTNSNSQTYRFDARSSLDAQLFREELFTAVAAQLVQKWPTREERDYNEIAIVSCKLTKTLIEQYNRAFSVEER